MQNVLYFLLCLFSETFEELSFVDHDLLVDIAPKIKLICGNEAFKEVYSDAVSIEDLKSFVAGKLVYSSGVMNSRELNLFLSNTCACHKGVISSMRSILPRSKSKTVPSLGCPVFLPEDKYRGVIVFGGSFYGFTAIHFRIIKAIHEYSVKKNAALVVAVAPDSIVLRNHATRGGRLLLEHADRTRVLKNVPFIDYLVTPDGEDIYSTMIIDTNATECIVCEEDIETIKHCTRHQSMLRKYGKDLKIITFEKIQDEFVDVIHFKELTCPR